MALRKYKVFKVFGWIVLSFFTLILLTTLGFYLGRAWIMNRAVTYLNDNQPGEIRMEQMNLIPFKSFPDVVLQLKSLSFHEVEPDSASGDPDPFLSLDEVYVTLDVVDLIRKEIQVSEIRLDRGYLKVELDEDSISNIEKALGIRLGKEEEDSPSPGNQVLGIHLDQIELHQISLIYRDHSGDNHLSLQINELLSSLSYLPEKINAEIQLNVELDSLKYLTYSDKESRNISLFSEVAIDPVEKIIKLSPSSLAFSGLDLITWGSYDYFSKPRVDLEFKASNEGLELLNYLFRGILDLNEVEQIGSGSIHLDGHIKGPLGDSLPVFKINGSARQLGFKIKSIGKDVSNISFDLEATNGEKLDFSEASLQIEGFSASFPEGSVNANISATNMLSPQLNIELDGRVNLAGLEKMIQSETLSELEGIVSFNGQMEGQLNRETQEIVRSKGSLNARLQNLGFTLLTDSLRKDSVRSLYGELFMKDSLMGTNRLTGIYNGNSLQMGLSAENVLLYVFGMDVDVKAEMYATAETLKVATLVKDTALIGLLGEELRGLHFRAGAHIKHQELEDFLETGSLPQVEISVDSFGIELPVYADISELSASITFGEDSIAVHYVEGVVGESEFAFNGLLSSYGALTGHDSAEVVSLEFDVSSDLMRAEDFFTLKGEFLLPETYHSEYLEDFHIAGSVKLPAEGLIHDSVSLDFDLNVRDLGWKFRYYPLTFRDFDFVVNRSGNRLLIEDFQGHIGESNLKMTATLDNFLDTLVENLSGELVLESELLDFNQLLNYQLPDEMREGSSLNSARARGIEKEEPREPPRLDQIDYPRFSFKVDIGELRYGGFHFFNLKGRLRSTSEKIFYMDELSLAGKSGGSMAFEGQFNVANPYLYTLSAELDIQDINVDDLDVPMQMGDTIYRLKENFDGRVSADGLGEIFITPDLQVDMGTTTAVFNVKIEDGALINFTPLQAAAKFLENKDLNYVKFATLQNSLPLTLIDSRIVVPIMNIESTVGQMLIEGEQGLDNSFLYLVRIPPNLARAAARSVLTDSRNKGEEEEIQEMRRGNFYSLTVWSDGINSDFKLGDRRSRFEE